MPYDSHDLDSHNEYLDTLNAIENHLDSINFDAVYCLGDMNCDPFFGRFWNYLTNFINRNFLSCFDVECLPRDSFTYISDSEAAYVKWLDHIVGRNSTHVHIKDVKIHQHMIGSDHLPISCNIVIKNLGRTNCVNDVSDNLDTNFINWFKLSDNDMVKVCERVVNNYLCDVDLSCHVSGCGNEYHKKGIDNFYDTFTSACKIEISKLGDNIIKKNKNFQPIPGWNRNCKELYRFSRQKFLAWVRNGRPRNHFLHFEMIEAKKNFKRSFNVCKYNKSEEINISIREKYAHKNMSEFWKEVKSEIGQNKQCKMIDGETEVNKILETFTNKFLNNNLISNVENKEADDRYINQYVQSRNVNNNNRKMNLKISPITLIRHIKNLNPGVGHDSIHTKLLKKSSGDILIMLTKFFNSCLSHNYIPSHMLLGEIRPLVKDLKNNVNNSSNYRPVMQSSNLLKIFEMILLEVLEEKVKIHTNQFGYEKGVSTTEPALILKQIIHNKIKIKNAKLYCVFADMSKAFERVNYRILLDILIRKNVPHDLISILMFYLRNQTAYIKWHGKSTEIFKIHIGTRQGGCISPFIFKLYVDEMVSDVNMTNLENTYTPPCQLGFHNFNILAYADDMVLIAHSKKALQCIYEVFSTKIIQLKLQLNIEKTKCVIFAKNLTNMIGSKMRLHGSDEFEIVDSYKYLGFLLKYNLDDSADIEYRVNKFYGKFYSLKRSFKQVGSNVLYFLFNSYCAPDYGIALWDMSKLANKGAFKIFEKAYIKVLKRVFNYNYYDSNHLLAKHKEFLLFKEFCIYVQCRYYKRLCKNNTKYSILAHSTFKNGYLGSLNEKLIKNYQVNFFHNDLDVLKSRITYIQNTYVQ